MTTIKKFQELANINNNILLNISEATAVSTLSKIETLGCSIALDFPANVSALKVLYKSLTNSRQQKFLFILPEEELSNGVIFEYSRCFFLSNYIFNNNSPVLLARDHSSPNQLKLEKWCTEQGFDTPTINVYENFKCTDLNSGDLIFVPSALQSSFLSFHFDNILELKSWNRKVILACDSELETLQILNLLNEFSSTLEQKHHHVFEVLKRLILLENELKTKQSTIQFQEIEINNHKLYNTLIRNEIQGGNNIITPEKKSAQSDIINQISENNKLWTEIGRLRNEIAWYKRTYEERSLLGTIKEKLLKNIKKR